MITKDELFELVYRSFPKEPLPPRFFWDQDKYRSAGDIPDELRHRITGRVWTDITMDDWRMVGTHSRVSTRYLDPPAFVYYAPSLLVQSIDNSPFIDWFLEAIVPNNIPKIPRGKWWHELMEQFDNKRRTAIGGSLEYIQEYMWDILSESDRFLLYEAKKIWL